MYSISQRRVKFPLEFDALDIVTDDLKQKLLPVNTKLKTIDKDRAERRKIRKRSKGVTQAQSTTSGEAATNPDDSANTQTAEAAGAIPEERDARAEELRQLEELIDPELKNDIGCSVTGLYDLVGKFASVTSFYVSYNSSATIFSYCDTQRCCSGCRALHGLREEERLTSRVLW